MPAKKVKFYAKRPNMEISIDGKIYKFESGNNLKQNNIYFGFIK